MLNDNCLSVFAATKLARVLYNQILKHAPSCPDQEAAAAARNIAMVFPIILEELFGDVSHLKELPPVFEQEEDQCLTS